MGLMKMGEELAEVNHVGREVIKDIESAEKGTIYSQPILSLNEKLTSCYVCSSSLNRHIALICYTDSSLHVFTTPDNTPDASRCDW